MATTLTTRMSSALPSRQETGDQSLLVATNASGSKSRTLSRVLAAGSMATVAAAMLLAAFLTAPASEAEAQGGSEAATPSASRAAEESRPSLTVERKGDPYVIEGGTARFTVALSQAAERAFDVGFDIRTNSTADSNDFSLALTPPSTALQQSNDKWTLRFERGDQEKTLVLTATTAGGPEGSEVLMLDFYRNFNNSSDYAVTPESGRALIWIRDADMPVVAGIFRPGMMKVAEGDSTPVSVYLLGTRTGTVTVPFEVEAGVVSPSDYSLTASKPGPMSAPPPSITSVTFAPTEYEKTIYFNALADNLYEMDEKPKIKLSTPPNSSYVRVSDSQHVFIKIMNQDTPPVAAISQADSLSVAEGSNMSFTVSLSPLSFQATTVRYNLDTSLSTASLADINFPDDKEVIIPANTEEMTFTLPTIGNDADTAAESVHIRLLDNPASTYTVSSTEAAALVAWIHEVNALPQAIIVPPGGLSLTEGSSQTLQVYLVGASARPVKVSYSVAHAGAENLVRPLDYFLTPSRSLTFNAGEEQKAIEFLAANDDLDEATETAMLSLAMSAAYAAHPVSGSVAFSINDAADDAPPIASITDLVSPSATEGAFKIRLNAASGRSVAVPYELGSAATILPADIEFSPEEKVAFPPGETEQLVKFRATNDSLPESRRTLVVELQAEPDTVSDPSYALRSADKSATVTIPAKDNSNALPVASLVRMGPETVSEDASEVEFKIALTKAPKAPDQAVQVGFEVDFSKSEALPSDFTLPGVLTKEFTPDSELAYIVTVAIVDDKLDEADTEKLTLKLTAGAGYTLHPDNASASVLLGDNDDRPMASISSSGPIFEGSEGVFAISLSEVSGRTVTVDYATEDYNFTIPASNYSLDTVGSVRFAPGETYKKIVLDVRTDDNTRANDDSVLLRLNPVDSNDAYTLHPTDRSAFIRIKDLSESAVPLASIKAASNLAVEGTSGDDSVKGSFTIALSRYPAQGETILVSYTVRPESGAAANSDYRLLLDGIDITGTPYISFRDNVKSRVLTVSPVSDDVSSEPLESLVIALTPGAAYGVEPLEGSDVVWIRDAGVSAAALPEVHIKRLGAKHVLEGQSRSFEVALLGAVRQSPVTVAYSVVTEATSSDYSLPNVRTVTIPANEASATVVLTALDDMVAEPDELLQIQLDTGTGYVVSSAAAGVAEAIIVDTDSAPVAALTRTGAANLNEGETRNFALVLDKASQDYVKVNYGLAADSLRFASDVSLLPDGAVVFTPGELRKVVSLTSLENWPMEADKLVKLVLQPGAGYSFVPAMGTASVTIVDTSLPVASISGGGVVLEDAEGAFTVSLSGVPKRSVTVAFEVDDAGTTADKETDFTLPVPASVTFTPEDATPKTFSVDVIDDTTAELDERITLKLVADEHYTVSPDENASTAVLVIQDNANDLPPVASIELATANGQAEVAEGTRGSFKISFPEPPAQPVRVYYGVDSASSASSADHDLDLVGYHDFKPGDAASIPMPFATMPDTLDEATETIVLYLFDGPGYSVSPSARDITLEITDDPADLPPVASIELVDAGGRANVSEGAIANFAITLDAASGREVEVRYSLDTDNSTATSGDFKPAFASGSVVFKPGVTSMPVSLPVAADGMAESLETVVLKLLADAASPARYTVSEADASAKVNIAESDGWEATASIRQVGAARVTEPEDAGSAAVTVVFEISLNGPSSMPVTVTYIVDRDDSEATQGAGRDFTLPATQEVLFRAGTTGPHQVVLTVLHDVFDEPDESATLKLKDGSGYGVSQVSGEGSAGVVIVDNDDPPTVSIATAATAAAPVVEGGELVYTVTLSAAVEQPVEVSFAVVDTSTADPHSSTSVTDQDYASPADMSVTFNPDDPLTKQVTIQTHNDALDELAETLVLQLADGTLYDLDPDTAKQSATGYIGDDNDTPPVASIEFANGTPASVSEGTTVSFTISLSTASGREVTVPYSLAAVDYAAVAADFTPTLADGSAVVFRPGEALSQTKQFTVTADGVVEFLETAEVALGAPSLTDPAYSLANATKADSFKITEHPDFKPEVSLDLAGDAAVSEAGGVTEFKFHTNGPISQPLAISYAYADSSTATATVDFTLQNATTQASLTDAGSVQLPAGQTVFMVELTAVADTPASLYEGDEELGLELAPVTSSTAYSTHRTANSATVTITEQDPPPTVSLEAPATATEGSPVELTVRLDAAAERDIDISYTSTVSPPTAATASPAQVTVPAGPASIKAGQLFTTITITSLTDTTPEPDTALTLTLTSGDHYTLNSDPAQTTATTTLRDATTAGTVTLKFKGHHNVHEDQTLEFTAELPAPAIQDLTIAYEIVANDSTADYTDDYTIKPAPTTSTGTRTGTITIPAGQRSAAIELIPNQNTTSDMPDETVTLKLTGFQTPSGTTVDTLANYQLNQTPQTATIYDGPTPEATVTHTTHPTDPYFTISLNGARAARNIKITYQTTTTHPNQTTTTKTGTATIDQLRSSKTVYLSDLKLETGYSSVTMLLVSCPDNSCKIAPTGKETTYTTPTPDNN